MTFKLRVLADKLARAMPIAALRNKLGGEAAPCEQAGRLVRVEGRDAPGVLLDVDGDTAHVFLGDGRVLKRARADVSDWVGAPPGELVHIARAAVAYRAVREGAAVTFRDAQGKHESGVVVCRCRFGAVIARDDGSMIGAGFQVLTRETHDA